LEYTQNTPRKLTATLKYLIKLLWNNNMEYRGTNNQQHLNCVTTYSCACWLAGHPKHPFENICYVFFVRTCKLTDEIFLPAMTWIHSLTETWLRILAIRTAWFSSRLFSPMWQKKKSLNYDTLKLQSHRKTKHFCLGLCIRTWTQWLNNVIQSCAQNRQLWSKLCNFSTDLQHYHPKIKRKHLHVKLHPWTYLQVLHPRRQNTVTLL